MGQKWRLGWALAAAGCHSGGPFDLSAPALGGDPSGSIVLPSQGREQVQPDAGVQAPGAEPTASVAERAPAVVPFRPPRAALLGEACAAASECASQSCSDGRCCNRPCSDCEACSSEGRCEGLPECRFASCDAGVCSAARGALGARCDAGAECASGFCADGVCCESACDGVCQQCSELGYCNRFPAREPACRAVTCPADTECLVYEPPLSQACAELGRCASAEHCEARPLLLGSACGEPGARCDGAGACLPASLALPLEPTQLCPVNDGGGPREVRAQLPDGFGGCWAGPSFADGITYAHGTITQAADGSTTLGINAFGLAGSAKTQGFDAAGRALQGCVVVDNIPDRIWVYSSFRDATCRGVEFARVTAHASVTGDL